MYDGYGKLNIWDCPPGDFDLAAPVSSRWPHGLQTCVTFDATDQTRFTAALGVSSGVPAKDPLADLDLDGDVDLTDSGKFTSIKNGGGASY